MGPKIHWFPPKITEKLLQELAKAKNLVVQGLSRRIFIPHKIIIKSVHHLTYKSACYQTERKIHNENSKLAIIPL